MRLSAMGDVAMTVPVIRALIDQYPTVKVTVISRPFFKPFFNDIPNVSFFEFDAKVRHKGFLGLLRLYSDLKKHNITAFADLHDVLRSKIIRSLFRLNGIQVANTDKGRAEKKALTQKENKVFKPIKTMIERHCDTFEKLGFSIGFSNPVFPDKMLLDQQVTAITGSKTNKVWIGIAPMAQYESKMYPLDLMKELVNLLARNENTTIFIFGAKNEKEVLEKLTNNAINVINLAGKVSFAQELQLISNLDLMLSMDSGNGHIAAMYGTKVVSLWGATHPFAGFAPFHQPIENAFTADRNLYPQLPTSIYGNKIVEGYQDAMRTIAPETVANYIIDLLNITIHNS